MKRETHYGDDGEFTKQEFFVCSCGNWQDHIVMELDRSNWGEQFDGMLDDSLHLHVQMNHFLPWYKRAWRALMYVFARDAKWIHWSETMIKKSDAIRMRELLTEYIESPHTRDE